jgi:hypothetical protein
MGPSATIQHIRHIAALGLDAPGVAPILIEASQVLGATCARSAAEPNPVSSAIAVDLTLLRMVRIPFRMI